ncbi:hypothetical protein OEA41_004140 [Lepraria neglecta]|uniref:Uncharacterized protein n=1 Tax=Lepraria neglecta TaxID=209136 RepID=A0AAD9Z6U9_9LECA|nr:hypothetical protein OEA41_004140 [Lepraria neglecta]
MPRNEVPKPQDGKVDTSIWGLPKILSQPKVHVRRPKNPKELVEMDNPLHHFTFPAEKDYENAKGRKKMNWNRSGVKPVADPETGRIFTVCSPRSDGLTSLEDLNGKIQAQAQNFATKVWHILNPDVEGSGNYLDPKDPLYNEKMQMSDKDRNRLRTWESFSNHIKETSNIDRIFALFQALYPDTWVAKDGEVNVASELYPFFKDTKNFYNSNNLRD